MSRLQKKCLLAAACTHLLLVVALLCSGFVRPRSKPQDATPVIELFTLPTDQPTSGETPTPTQPPPTPTPPITPPPPPVKPPEPQPEVKPVVQTPVVEPPDQPEQPNDPESVVPKPPPKKIKREIKVDLDKVVTRPTPKVRDTSEEDAKAEAEAAKELKRLQDQKNKAIKSLLNNLNKNLSSTTPEFKLPGNDKASRANYLSLVVSAYHHAWIAPSHMTGESAVVTFAVTIARDGSVVSAHIESRSGDASVDEAVQRMLNRVTSITPFPEESTDQERTYNIDFNATRTSQ